MVKTLRGFLVPAVAKPVVLLAMGLSAATTTPAQSTTDLVAQLGSVEAQRREAAAWSLGAAPDASAIPALAKALKDPDEFVRLTAAWALRETGTPKALDLFYPLLVSQDLGGLVLKTLEGRYDPAAQKALVAAVERQPSVELRLRALKLLDENFTQALLPVFRAVAQGDDELLKIKALPALVRRRLLAKGDDLVPVFVSFLDHPDPAVRVEAIRGLQGFDDERVIELFEEAIADVDPKVHEAALGAFCALVDRGTLPTLERLYESASGPDRATILSSPPAEKWELMEPLYYKALEDPHREPRVALMRLLRYRYYSDPEALRVFFLAGAGDADPEVRRQAGGGLAALPSGSLDVLAHLASDDEAMVRAEVLGELIQRERRDAKGLIGAAVRDTQPSVRLLVVEGLVRLMST